MHSDDSISHGLFSFLDRLKKRVAGFGLRVLVHICSLVAAGIIGGTVDRGVPFVSSEAAVVASVYVGMVCLLPRGMSLTSQWVIPTGVGLLQMFLLLVAGAPWQLTFLWGGLQTWVQRLLQAKGSLGWEWSALPWLLLGLYAFFSDTLPSVSFSPFLVTFPVLALVGWAFRKAYARFRVEPIHRGIIARTALQLQRQLSSRPLPGPLEAPLRQLAEQADRFVRQNPRMDEQALAMARDIEALAPQVARLSGRANPKEWDVQAGRIFSEVARLNEEFAARQVDYVPEYATIRNGLDEKVRERIELFHTSALQLTDKKYQLPPDMHAHIDGLRAATENILDCMRKDPADVGPGDKFLSRYLKSAHMVVDEYVRFSRDGSGHTNVEQVLAHSRELMARLEKAFVEEHKRLLQNDTINFTAELNVLDKLLRMEGK